jgi:tetratricopeptide (TPR) repeat protein
MCDRVSVSRLGAYLGAGIDEELAASLSSRPDSAQALDLICRSAAAFQNTYSPDNAKRILTAIFATDFGMLPDMKSSLAANVFERLPDDIRQQGWEAFEAAFQRFIRWFRMVLTALMYANGLRNEGISLDSATLKDYLAELRELPCRRLSERHLSCSTGLSQYVETLLKRYEGTVIAPQDCHSILNIMSKVAGHPAYYKTMDAYQRSVEVRPLMLAISSLQLYSVKEPAKSDLLAALSILLFNVFPTSKLLKFIANYEPGPGNDALSYDFNAILAMNYLIIGRLDTALAYNEKALCYAGDDEQKAYTYLLESCILLSRRDYDAAVAALSKCPALSKDRQTRSAARFYTGIVYYEMGDPSKALECFRKSRSGLDDEIDLMNVCNNIGSCAMLKRDRGLALKAFENVEYIGRYMSSMTARSLRAVASGCLGIIYFNEGAYDRAMSYFKEGLKLAKDFHDKKGAANQLGNIGMALRSTQDNKLALEYFKSALSVSFNCDYIEGVLFSFGQIEQLLALEGKFEMAEALRQDAIRRNPGIARMLEK